MDKTVLTLAVDSTQVGTAAAAFDRMVNAGNAAATSAGKVTSTALNQGRIIGQTLVPALNRGAASARTMAEAQRALSDDATRQIGQTAPAYRPRVAPAAAPAQVAPVPQGAATGRAVPIAIPGVNSGFGQLPGAADSAQSAIDRLTASARTNRSALVQLTPAAEATVRTFRQIGATPIKIAAPQGLSQAAAAFAQAQRLNPQPMRQAAAAFGATADQAKRAADAVTQANRVIGAAPRGGMTMQGAAPRAPLSAQEIVSSTTGQRVPTGGGFSTSEMTVEAGRAQGAIERLTSAARNQSSALAQVTANAGATADAYREMAGAQPQPGSLAGLTGGRFVPGAAGPGNRANPSNGGSGGRPPTPNAGGQGGDYRSDQIQQLSFQLNDLFVQIASGGSVLTALIQQGSQLSGTFGGVRPAFQAVLSLLTPMRVAIGGVAAVLGTLALAYRQGAKDSKDFANAIILSGNYAGQTEGQFNALAKRVSASSQATVGSAREMAQALLATGEIGPQVFDQTTEAAVRYSEAYGKSAAETADFFAKLADSPSKFASELNKSMNLWDASALKAISDAEKGEDAWQAQKLVLDKLVPQLQSLDSKLDGIDRALVNGKKAWADFWDAAKQGTGGADTVESNIVAIERKIRAARNPSSRPYDEHNSARPSPESVEALEYQLQDQLSGQQAQQANALSEAATKEASKKADEARQRIERLAKLGNPKQALKDEQENLKNDFKNAEYGGIILTDQQKKDALAGLDPAKKGPKNNEASQLLAAQLQTDLRRIDDLFEQQRDAFEFQNRFVEAAYREGNISLRTLMDQRREVIEGSAKAEIEALDKEAARLQQQLKVEKDPSERIQIKGQIEEVTVRRDRVELQASRDVTLLNQEEAASYRALTDQVTEYRAQLLQLAGDEAGAAALRAQTAIANAKLLAAQSGGQISDDEVNELARRTQALNQFNEVQRQATLLAGNAARAEEAFAMSAELSGKSLLETERGIYEIRVKELDQLGALTQKARELAEVSADPRIKAYAADLALMYAKAANAVDPALNKLRDANRQLAAGLASTAGQAPNAFIAAYGQRRLDSGDEVKSEKESYDRRINLLEGYLAETRDAKDKARLRERIAKLQAEKEDVKGESRGSSALKAINEAVVQPMAEQVFATVNKLLITDPLETYLKGQLTNLTEGNGILAGFFKDALGIKADPKLQAEQQQTAAITASSNALQVLTSAAQDAANALRSRGPIAAGPAAAVQGAPAGQPVAFDPSQPPPVDSELAGVTDEASESVSQMSAGALSATSDLARLASAAGVGGSAMAQLPGIIGLFQAAVAAMSASGGSGGGGGGFFGAIASLFSSSGSASSASSAALEYELAANATGIYHSGGVVGNAPATRNVASSVFANAPKYHTGGIVGKAADKASAKLAANEVPAILMGGPKGKREEVLTADDPRHRDNLGMSIVARIMAESKHEGLKVKGARELGGPVSANSMYRVNEKGPELLQVAGKQYLMTGAQGGNVVPNDGGKGGDTTIVHVNVTPPAGASTASAKQFGVQTGRGIQHAMRRNT